MDRMSSMPAEQTKQLLEVYRRNLGMLRRNSVQILIGSDQFRKNARDEALSLAREKLLTSEELLHAWCEVTPQAIFPKRKITRLKDGYEANFVVLRTNPLEDFTAVKDVLMTFKFGEQVGPPPKK